MSLNGDVLLLIIAKLDVFNLGKLMHVSQKFYHLLHDSRVRDLYTKRFPDNKPKIYDCVTYFRRLYLDYLDHQIASARVGAYTYDVNTTAYRTEWELYKDVGIGALCAFEQNIILPIWVDQQQVMQNLISTKTWFYSKYGQKVIIHINHNSFGEPMDIYQCARYRVHEWINGIFIKVMWRGKYKSLELYDSMHDCLCY